MRLPFTVLASVLFGLLAYGSPVANVSASSEELEAQGVRSTFDNGFKFISALKYVLKNNLPDAHSADGTKPKGGELKIKLDDVSGVDDLDSFLQEKEAFYSTRHQAACTASLFEYSELFTSSKISWVPIPSFQTLPFREELITCVSAGGLYFALVGSRFLLAREMEVPDSSSGALLRNLHNLDFDSVSKDHKVMYFDHLGEFGYPPVDFAVTEAVTVKMSVVPPQLLNIGPYVSELEKKGLHNTAGLLMWHFVTPELAANLTEAQLEVIHHPRKLLISANKEEADTYTIMAAPFQTMSDIAKHAASLTPGKSSLSNLYKTRGFVSITVRNRPVYFPDFDPDAVHSTIEEGAAAARDKALIDKTLKESRIIKRLGSGKLSDFCYTFADYSTKSVIESEFRFGGFGEINNPCKSSLVTYDYEDAQGAVGLDGTNVSSI